jgi:3-oxoacyl-[acyl-carrier-protein] synthase II
MRRVVITGMGVKSALGNTAKELCNNIENSVSAVRYMPEWDKYADLRSRIAAPCPISREETAAIPRSSRRSMSRMGFFATLAAERAVADAGVDQDYLSSGRVGCIVGSTTGSPSEILETMTHIITEETFADLSPMQVFKCFAHTASMNVSSHLNLTGYTAASSAACASSLQAVGLAADMIAMGRQEAVLCGGSEEVDISVTASFDALYVASTHFNKRPELASRPFHRHRDGLVCGGGAGILMLEEYEHARKRGARIYGEVKGYSTCANGTHISQSNEESMCRCLNQALREAKFSPADIDYINAHATSTPHGDTVEIAALNKIFGGKVPTSSLKGLLGHTLGASGSIELIICLEMMQRGLLYPTHNLDDIADDCRYDGHVTEIRQAKINTLVKNCFAFGGINAVLVCEKI